jgi:hypothetical protein
MSYDMWVEKIDGTRVEHPENIQYPSQLNTWAQATVDVNPEAEVLVTVWKHDKGEVRKKFYNEKCWTIDTIALEWFEKLCQEHDWYYAYSDDHRVWKAGVNADAKLRGRYSYLCKTDVKAAAEAIWERYAKA